ncbi:hypothetical protein [Mucilaginibacter panaciglaebae]|uniref:Uncharacterized protein n=1 Tax=Mucilaginibacter panaciglaebae TaxID=502331 RepID=A0ABP7WUD0_9SPHI
MTPTPEEKQWLHDYLYQIMQYRETFEEVYDHILLALEDMPRPQFFESAIARIITNDFGSDNGLYELEQNCRRAANRDIVKQYTGQMRAWLSAKFILFTGLIIISSALLILRFPVIYLIIINVFFFIIPVLLYLFRKVVAYIQRGYKKASLKDEISTHITFRVTVFIWAIGCIINWTKRIIEWILKIPQETFDLMHRPKPFDVWFVMGGLISVGLLTWMILHFIAVIKLYQREFKSNMIKA